MVWAKVGDEGRLKPAGVYWNSSMQVSVQYTDGEVTRNVVDAYSGAWAVKVGEDDEQ
jgi:hypothetical protein